MKRFFTVLTAGLLILAITAPAMAWEFSMNGEYIQRLIYAGRTGVDDLFGNGNNVGFAGPNIYQNAVGGPNATFTGVPAANKNNSTGQVITRGGFSVWESDMLLNDQRLTLVPTIRVNNAIRVHGVYNVGGYRNAFQQNANGVGIPPFERYYQLRTSTYVYGTGGIGSWEQVRITVQMPIAVLSIGIKDFPFGTGAALANHTASDALFLIVPYGPLRLFWAQWLGRNAPFAGEGYNTNPDSGNKRDYFGTPMGLGGTYENANLQVFWLVNFLWSHVDPGYVPGGSDIALASYGAGFKYNNGRFFANLEYDWTDAQFNRTVFAPGGIAPVTFGGFTTQRNQESSLWFAEAGFLCGPAKLGFMWGWSSGQQLAAPGTIGLFFPNPSKQRAIAAINYQAMEAYNYLMFYTYGGGNNVFDLDGHGNFGDANAYAARLDYAVASNLNVWGSYIWAERLEKDGYLAGQFFGVPVAGTLGTLSPGAPGTATANLFAIANGGTDPFAGNGFLGWEMNFGVDWKLLEGMSTFVRYAYWQPGDWFTRAYQYGTRVDGAVGALTNAPTIMKQGRSAINALYWSVVVNF